MIARDARGSASRGRSGLKLDPRSGKQMLLYPEKGLELNETAARVAALCARSARWPTSSSGWSPRPTARRRGRPIEDEVLLFLRALEDRGLLVVDAP